MPKVICKDLLSRDLQRHPERASVRIRKTDFSRFKYNEDVRTLVHNWFASSQEHASPFDAFRDLWQAFNAWAKLVTGQRRDRYWIDACMLNSDLGKLFARLRSDSTFEKAAREFQEWWPIFDADTINQSGISWLVTPRDEARDYYFQYNIPFSPPCWSRHMQAKEEHDFLDWPHTLSALYQVRNNLVHGAKSKRKGNHDLVKSAYEVLYKFLYKGGVLLL